MDYDPTTNIRLFEELLKVNLKVLIELGTKALEDRREKAKKLIANKRLIHLGGKDEQGKGRWGTCYALESDETEFRNEVCENLAIMSIADGFDNMGMLYSLDKASNQAKVSLRSLQSKEGGNCEIIAREMKGGGHYNAAGFFIELQKLRKWLDK